MMLGMFGRSTAAAALGSARVSGVALAVTAALALASCSGGDSDVAEAAATTTSSAPATTEPAPTSQPAPSTTTAPGTTFGVKQVLAEPFAENTNYTVTVSVGNSMFYDWAGFRVELWAGDTLLASDQDPDTTAPADGTFITSTLSYVSGSATPTPGSDLEIHLLSRGTDVDGVGSSPGGWAVDFDNVEFSSN